MLMFPEAEFGRNTLLQGFHYDTPDGRIKSKMDRGGTKTRGNSSGATTIVPWANQVGLSAVMRLRRFLNEEGAENAFFLIRDPQIDGRPILSSQGEVLLNSEGQPILISVIWLVKFDALPSETPLGGGQWHVSFSLERYPI